MDVDDELADVADVVTTARVPEGTATTEPSQDAIIEASRCTRVVDTSVFCRHSYIISVLCLRIEEMLEAQ